MRLVLRSDDGRALPLDPSRWHAEPTVAEWELLGRLSGPVLDVGCGPGRLVSGLARRGTVALGLDPAPGAVELAHPNSHLLNSDGGAQSGGRGASCDGGLRQRR